LRRNGGEAAARATEQELRTFLGSFGFSGDRVFEPIGPFSGGEKARLVLALVSYLRPNLLLLDEPTNHLDLEMRQALAVALQDFEAAVVLVSHDRHLLRAVADDLVLVDKGRAAPFDGDLDDYAKWFTTREAATDAAADGDSTASSAEARKQRKRDEAERRARLSPLRAEIAKLEKQMARLQSELSRIEAELASPTIYEHASKARLQSVLVEQARMRQELETVETSWLEASEKIEALQSDA
jgi:ATP-binding cassette subfamily F protein 3